MSTDLEARLTHAMHAAHAPDLLDVDAEAIVTGGRRAVRRRRTILGSACVALLLAIGVGVTHWSPLSVEDHRSVAPAATPHRQVVHVDPHAFDGSGQVGVEEWTISPDESLRRVTVTEERSDGSRAKQVLTWDFDDVPTIPSTDATVAPIRAGLRSLGAGTFLVVTPADASHAQLITGAAVPPHGWAVAGPNLERIDGTSYAVGLFQVPRSEMKAVAGFRMRLGDRVVDTRGTAYATTRLPDSDDLVWAAADGRFGIMTAEGSDSAWDAAGADEPGILGSFWSGPRPDMKADIPGFTSVATFGIAPHGATDIQVLYPENWPDQSMSYVTLPGREEQLVVARASAPTKPGGSPDTGAIRLAWTDARGKRHTAR